jgi:hypothetical protein
VAGLRQQYRPLPIPCREGAAATVQRHDRWRFRGSVGDHQRSVESYTIRARHAHTLDVDAGGLKERQQSKE